MECQQNNLQKKTRKKVFFYFRQENDVNHAESREKDLKHRKESRGNNYGRRNKDNRNN